jgi:class 3 adenylate cyclase/tetratricopeptide (TPR) repeat protein
MSPGRSPQRRHMTVMFCDLVDSTPLAESLDPEDFREVLTEFRRATLGAVERFGGYTAVYAGDGMTVYFGYPRAHEDDAQRAVHTGLAILDEVAALSARLRDALGTSIQVRIGLHSGTVIAEELGGGAGETPSQLDVSGEMPHIAKRLESLAPPGSVVASDATRALVEGYFDTEPLGEKALKGVSRPMAMHRIVRATGAIGRLEVAAARRLTPLVGRDSERATLLDAWEHARAGHGAVVHVTGEAGIGKSRLVHDLIDAADAQLATSQKWQCSPHHQSTALYPVRTFLERLLSLETAAADDDRLRVLSHAVAAAGIESREAVPLLADLLSVAGGDDVVGALAPRDARTQLLRVLESLLVTDSARHPLLLVVEDLHFADPTTVELLGRISRTFPGLPVLCVLTFRPDYRPPWRPDRSALEIGLGPLPSADVRALAAASSDQPVDADVLDWIESTADGVPLFVEEMLKVGDGPHAGRVPPTLEGLLTERLDRLPELADVIDLAAILGREFDHTLLRALEPLPAGELDGALTELAAHDVVRAVEGAPSRLEFSHGLLQEAAYTRILRRRRRELHQRVAETLVWGVPDVFEREPELVARHWSAADEPGRAVPFWHRAGTRALERAAYLEAAEHFRRGLEALDAADPDCSASLEHIDFLTHIGASLQAGRGYAAAGVEQAYARARTACGGIRSDDRLIPVIRGEWMLHLLRAEYATALELADEMLALAERGARPVGRAEGHLYRGLVHMYVGEFELARDELEQAGGEPRGLGRADHVYEAQGDTGVGALAYLALVLWNLGYELESLERSDLSIDRALEVGGPVTRAQAWGMRSILHLSRLEPVDMGEWVQRTRVHSVDHNIEYWRIVSSLLSGWLQGRAGELERGTARLRDSLEAYKRSGSRLGLPHFQILYADLRRVAGDMRGALDQLRIGEEYIEQSGERFSESELFRFQGRALEAGDRPDEDAARAAFERAVSVAQEQNAKLLELRAATRLAEHEQRLGEPCSVGDRLAALSDWFGPASRLPELARARALIGAETMAR